ncbi:Omp28-related outer membrane protein [Luteirhabdus pelagi]|uniref:Omp28-related outer membrane protein n=1 Tax=Luteirhabdus pelagi TaxID=2792783 RepID=UPI00193ABC45|nr:Omp28-related outer membrane protein [Luteirhabdus pelagi]
MKITKLIPLLLLTFLAVVACSKDEDFSGNDEAVTIVDENAGLVVRSSSLRNQEIPFRVFNSSEEEVTDVATFYVDEAEIEGSIFTSADEGTFEVYAQYEEDGATIETEPTPFSVIIPKRKITIEDYTGTWCGYCPRVTASIEEVHEETEHISVVAIHNDDEMALPFEQDLRAEFDVTGFPAGRINRTVNWINPHDPQDVLSIAGQPAPMAIGIESQLSGNDLAVKVTVASENELSNAKMVVYLVEDGLLYNQVNYYDNDESSPYFGQGNPIVDFEHNDVLRASLSNIFGDALPAIAALEEYAKNYSISLSSEYNTANLRLVVMLVDENNTAMNSQYAAIDSAKGFE